MARVGPKSGQEGGQMGTKTGQGGAREAQGGPKMARDGPKAAPKGGGKGPSRHPVRGQEGARETQERPKKQGPKKNVVLGPFRGLFWGAGRASGGHPGLSGGALFLDPFLDPSWGRQRPENFDFGPYVFQKSQGGCKPKYPKRTQNWNSKIV